jgi:hypothetical protein
MAPKKAAALAQPVRLGPDALQALAAELGIPDYKTLRHTSENLTNAENLRTINAKIAARQAAEASGDAAPVAAGLAAAAFAREVALIKMTKANVRRSKNGPGPQQPPEPAPDPAPAAALVEAQRGEPSNSGYLEAVQKSYNNVLKHRHFKDVMMLPPNPIRDDEDADCGVQVPRNSETGNLHFKRKRGKLL